MALPLPVTVQPSWLVPTNTDLLIIAAHGTMPVTLEVQAQDGDPDVLGVSSGHSAVAAVVAPQLAAGLFLGLPGPTGPFPAPTTGTVNLAAVASTSPAHTGTGTPTRAHRHGHTARRPGSAPLRRHPCSQASGRCTPPSSVPGGSQTAPRSAPETSAAYLASAPRV